MLFQNIFNFVKINFELFQFNHKSGNVSVKTVKTKAEITYEKAIEKRMEQSILRKAEMSYKDRVEIYNKKLDELTEYNDIPKVSWTK